MLLAGAVGTLVLGPVADRFGLRRTLLVTQALLTPAILVFVLVGGVAGAVALIVVGMCVVGTFGVTMVLSQLYLPRHVGMASGLAVGLSMGLGGIAALALGARGRLGRPPDGPRLLRARAPPRRRSLPLPARAAAPEAGCDGSGARIPSARLTAHDKETRHDRAGVLRPASLQGRPGQDRRA